jgi:hypothetical protein
MQPLVQGLADEQLHHQEGLAAHQTLVVDLDERRPSKLLRERGLTREAPPRGALLGPVEVDDLQRHLTAELLVVGRPDLAHAASADHFDELVSLRHDIASDETLGLSSRIELRWYQRRFESRQRPRLLSARSRQEAAGRHEASTANRAIFRGEHLAAISVLPGRRLPLRAPQSR